MSLSLNLDPSLKDKRLNAVAIHTQDHLRAHGPDLRGAIADSDFEYLLSRIEGSLGADHARRFEQVRKSDFYPLLFAAIRPYFEAKFMEYPDHAVLEKNDGLKRYVRRVCYWILPHSIAQILNVRQLKKSRSQKDRVWAAKLFPQFARKSATEQFVQACEKHAAESLLTEIIRQQALNRSDLSQAARADLERMVSWIQREWQAGPYSGVITGAEIVAWLGTYLANRKRGEDKFLANAFYFVLDRQLAIAKEIDKTLRDGNRPESHLYSSLQGLILSNNLFSRTIGAISGKLMRVGIGAMYGLTDDEMKQEVSWAALAAIDKFDYRKTSYPTSYFNRRIEWETRNRLRRWKKIPETGQHGKGGKIKSDKYKDPYKCPKIHHQEATESSAVGPESTALAATGDFKEILIWLRPLEKEVLIAKAHGEDDDSIAKRLKRSPSRIRGVAAQAKKKTRRKYTPETFREEFLLCYQDGRRRGRSRKHF